MVTSSRKTNAEFGSTAAHVMKVLGSPKRIKSRDASHWESQAVIRRGLPVRSIDRVCERLGISQREIAGLIHTTNRSIDRWRQSRKPLSDAVSDRLYRIARLIALAEEVFQDQEKVQKWMNRPNRAFRELTPLSLLDNEVGARHVEDTLRRLQHGIFG